VICNNPLITSKLTLVGFSLVNKMIPINITHNSYSWF